MTKGYHSIIFYDTFDDTEGGGSRFSTPIHTWDEWNLVPTKRPWFEPPKLKTNIVDVPSGSGALDLSTSLTGYPLYENRTGNFEFIVVNDTYEQADQHREWYDIYSDIMTKIHGKRLYAVLEDDPDWFYEGRFTVEGWSSDEHYSTVKIGFDVNPYKWSVKETRREVEIRSTDGDGKNELFYYDDLGDAPICPTLIASGSVNFFLNTPSLGLLQSVTLTDQTVKLPNFVLYTENVWAAQAPCRINMRLGEGYTYSSAAILFRKGKL